MGALENISLLKTKLGPARFASLRTADDARTVGTFPTDAVGKPLGHDEAKTKAGERFRAALFASAGTYRGRVPFRQVFAAVGGEGRLLIYDRFGLAVRWAEGKPVIRRRGLKLETERDAAIAALHEGTDDLFGWAGSYQCPSCRAAQVEDLDEGRGHFQIPLCGPCRAKVKRGGEWVGNWLCTRCGDRVPEDVLRCPFCESLGF